MATIIMNDKHGDVVSYPVFHDTYFVEGQVLSQEMDADDFDPRDSFRQIGKQDDEKYWDSFLEIARVLYDGDPCLHLADIMEEVEYNGITVIRPDVFIIFVESIDTDVIYDDGRRMIRLKEYEKEPDKYKKAVCNIAAHLAVCPKAKLRLIHHNKDPEFLKKLEKFEKDIYSYKERILGKPQKVNLANFSSNDYLEVFLYLSISFSWEDENDNLKSYSKENLLDNICHDLNIEEDCKEKIWDFITINNLVIKNEHDNIEDFQYRGI